MLWQKLVKVNMKQRKMQFHKICSKKGKPIELDAEGFLKAQGQNKENFSLIYISQDQSGFHLNNIQSLLNMN